MFLCITHFYLFYQIEYISLELKSGKNINVRLPTLEAIKTYEALVDILKVNNGKTEKASSKKAKQ